MQKSYESVTRQLRNQDAVGIVVAVTGTSLGGHVCRLPVAGEILAQISDTYATEALTMPGGRGETSIKEAERLLQIGSPGRKS
jgi:hypothetical protein